MSWILEALQAIADWLKPAPKPQPTMPEPVPPTPPVPPAVPAPEVLSWDTPQHSFHAVRVICDDMGLTVDQKNLICACIYQESGFKNAAMCQNKDPKTGQVWSTDWGICQINDHYHIGPGKDFASVSYVVNNPDAAVKWMIRVYKQGGLGQWVSYSSGAYKKWLTAGSPMWALRNNQ
jgi:hypothetical protein